VDAEQHDSPIAESPETAGPLPRGRHDLPPEVVERHQRDRLVAAVATVMADQGYGGLTVARVIAEARVSRSTFYGHFENKREAVLGAHQAIFSEYLAALESACEGENSWPEMVKAGIEATIDFALANPAKAQLLAMEFNAADLTLARGTRVSHDRLADLLGEGRRRFPATAALPAMTEEALIGAIASIVARGLVNQDLESSPALRSQLVELTLMPYLGCDGAAEAVDAMA
jgi:AcrR family transcriptional regulator